ncbi:MAG: DUF1189 family protein [Desulfomonilaceae bacterium]
MGTARSICKIPAIAVVLVLLVCAGLSAWGLFSWVWPKVETVLEYVVGTYDAVLPEITIRDGKATIREQQPHFIDTGDKDLVVVVDTREDKQKEALDYLKDVSTGAVLARDSVVTKSQGQIRIIPLKGIPDLVLNSRNLRALFDEYLPTVTRIFILVVILYFLIVKPIQAIIFALLPYFVARSYSAALTYGEAIKLSALAMVPPVTLDLFLNLSGIRIPMSFIIYFGLYIALLILAVRDLVRSKPLPTGPLTSINP